MRHKRGWGRILSGDFRIGLVGPFGDPSRESHVLHPRHMAQATVKPSLELPLPSVRTPQVSTRSILARLGVEASFGQRQVHEIHATGKTPETVSLMHHGEIPIRLRAGNRTHRIYYPSLVAPLKHSEIRRLQKSGQLVLGRDCRIFANGLIEITPHPVVYEIPQAVRQEIAQENWAAGSKRNKLMQLLQRKRKPVKTRTDRIVLAETKPVRLPEDVGLFLQPTSGGKSFHLHSMVVDPGFQGPIILEILGLQHGKRPDKIQAWLVRPLDV